MITFAPVEGFELIATTGKNAKAIVFPPYQLFSIPLCYLSMFNQLTVNSYGLFIYF
jgi:hypothetical protein